MAKKVASSAASVAAAAVPFAGGAVAAAVLAGLGVALSERVFARARTMIWISTSHSGSCMIHEDEDAAVRTAGSEGKVYGPLSVPGADRFTARFAELERQVNGLLALAAGNCMCPSPCLKCALVDRLSAEGLAALGERNAAKNAPRGAL